MNEENTAKSRTYRKASVNAYLDAKAHLRASDREMMEALGYQEGSWRYWIETGHMPFVAAIACEALVRRRKAETSGEIDHVLITLEQGKPKSFTALVSVKTMKIDEKEYYLVPKR